MFFEKLAENIKNNEFPVSFLTVFIVVYEIIKCVFLGNVKYVIAMHIWFLKFGNIIMQYHRDIWLTSFRLKNYILHSVFVILPLSSLLTSYCK